MCTCVIDRIIDMIPSGTYSRLSIGIIILTQVITYNETGAITVFFSAFVATICAILSGEHFRMK